MTTAASALLDHPLIGQRYFFPRRAAIADPFVVDVPGAQLHCHRSAPHASAPMLLHFHGNGEVVADWRDELVPAFNDRGLNVVLAEYRGYGGSTGQPALAQMLDDSLAIADAVGASKLYVYGRSVGSLYALHVASERDVAGLIIESGISDVAQRIRLRVQARELGVDDRALDAAFSAHFDHKAKIERVGAKVLVIHTEHDHLVPVEHAHAFARWAGDAGTLNVLPEGDHNSIFAYNGSRIIEQVAEFCA